MLAFLVLTFALAASASDANNNNNNNGTAVGEKLDIARGKLLAPSVVG
ncbi:uncharacterized protein ACO6RY_05485 [Pungitius sinensis]